MLGKYPQKLIKIKLYEGQAFYRELFTSIVGAPQKSITSRKSEQKLPLSKNKKF